jgi:polar amino acid transport system substrate-binding protein
MVEFTHPYAVIENAYLVAATASIRSAADADEPGVRIGVARDTAADLRLTRVLRHARLIRMS